jgi:phosphoglycerate dehydrogenase-like enzyme
LQTAPRLRMTGQSPLWKTPHLMITPHTSAVSDRLWKRQTEILAELLERWFGGRQLFNRVDDREAISVPRGGKARLSRQRRP